MFNFSVLFLENIKAWRQGSEGLDPKEHRHHHADQQRILGPGWLKSN